MKFWGFIFVEAVLLACCSCSPISQGPPLASAPPLGGAPLSQVDLGASILAEVGNARFAVSLRDPIAAGNDVDQAVSLARQLPDRPSNLLPSEPAPIEPDRPSGVSGTGISYARLTVFGAMVKLTSAQAELDGSNLEEADADLAAIQNGIPKELIPNDLPLLRAAASLDLARSAASEGRTSDLRTQLLSAQLALSTYAGPSKVAEAKALAAIIGQSLKQAGALNTMQPYQLSLWLGRVVTLSGAARWSAQSP
jgi:hypothetical protein